MKKKVEKTIELNLKIKILQGFLWIDRDSLVLAGESNKDSKKFEFLSDKFQKMHIIKSTEQ